MGADEGWNHEGLEKGFQVWTAVAKNENTSGFLVPFSLALKEKGEKFRSLNPARSGIRRAGK